MVPHFPGAKKTELASILNKQLIIKDFKEMPSTISEGKEIFFNSGEIVLKQLKEVKDKLPLKAAIVRKKGKRYYELE